MTENNIATMPLKVFLSSHCGEESREGSPSPTPPGTMIFRMPTLHSEDWSLQPQTMLSAHLWISTVTFIVVQPLLLLVRQLVFTPSILDL